MQYVNKNLPAESRLLLIFLGKRGYYCNREYIPDTPQQVNNLYRLIKNAHSPHDLVEGFDDMGVTHLIIEIRFFNTWMNNLFDEERRSLVKAFFANYTSLSFAKNGVGVFRLATKS